MANINYPDSKLKDEQSYDLEETYKPHNIIPSCLPQSLKAQFAFRIVQQSNGVNIKNDTKQKIPILQVLRKRKPISNKQKKNKIR